MLSPLFVYGTLRPGQRAHELLASHVQRAVFATMPGYLLLLPGGYPGLIDAAPFSLPADGIVVGELLWLDDAGERDALWRRLDDYEGHEYTRVIRRVITADARAADAHVYVLVAEVAQSLFTASRLIRSGDFARTAAL